MIVQLGNTSFTVENFEGVTFDQFNATYAGLLQGYDIKKAYKVIQSKLPKKAQPKKSVKKHGKQTRSTAKKT